MAADKHNYNENTRVQVPGALHLVKLGYKYVSRIADDDYEHSTNILKPVFLESIKRLNPLLTDAEVQNVFSDVVRMCRDNDDLGREFFTNLTSETGIRLIDFNNPDNNQWHVTTEFTCENERTKDNFRPDITAFVNGMPLVYIEVKKPNNKEGMKPERERTETRIRNKAFKSFMNITQFMVFSNNMEYNEHDKAHFDGSYYASMSKGKVFFNLFREEEEGLYERAWRGYDITDDEEKEVLLHRNCPTLKALDEYQTNKKIDTPCNRILTSMLSKERLLFLLRYGIVYVDQTIELKDGTKVTELQKHIMRYQQIFATKAINRKLEEGANGGIIWHTQGSGKTALAYYNVKYLTRYFAAKNTPVKFYFIVDRLDLLEQASQEFAMRGLSVRTAETRKELMDDFSDSTVRQNPEGKPEIMVVNIQRFATDHQKVTKKEVYSTNLKHILFIDEAHRGYDAKGSFLANLLTAAPDSIRIALTGTPLLSDERESWRVFGNYIHTYYYDKSIADGYTLKLLREDIETRYKTQITEILDKLTTHLEIKKRDIDHNVIIEDETYVGAVLDYILKDLRRSRIQQAAPKMGGMIVCETNPQARVMYRLFCESQQGEQKPLRAALILHDEGDKEERKFSITEFKKKDTIDVLIVNAMLLTGFDAPRLKKLYLMRKLDGHGLLQALTRVNRPYQGFKFGYVVDFANIKENFIETNNLYMRELNRTNNPQEGGIPTGEGAGNALLVTPEEVISQMRDIKETLFQYNIDNAEEFRQQLDGVDDKERLYTLRHTLEDAKALSNQVRSFGDEELKERFSALEFGGIPSLISEVNHRIERINLLESTDHKTDVSAIIREALSMMQYELRLRGREELEIVFNDLRERYDKVEREFAANIDHDDERFVSLSEDFRKYFAKKGFTPDNVAAARDDIYYIDAVMDKIKEINRANKVLQSKYHDDAKFARLHKRIREENERRRNEGQQNVLISEREVEIACGLNEVKHAIDDVVYLDYNKLFNQGYFDQVVMKNITEKLYKLGINPEREDRIWLRRKIANEYLESYA